MELLQAGVDRRLIALWLGHESVGPPRLLDADLAMKESPGQDQPRQSQESRFRPDDELLGFLKGL